MSVRRSRDGGYVVSVDSLRVGDRLRLSGSTGTHRSVQWVPIVEIAERPKTRVVFYGGPRGSRFATGAMRRTTLVARGPREGEAAA
jgi:tartrate dehydratase beta subunit/fumarate hydratase class I family protein